MLLLPAGTFLMGAPYDKAVSATKRPARQITRDSFLLDEYELTRKKWSRVIGKNPAYFCGDDSPVEQVSETDC